MRNLLLISLTLFAYSSCAHGVDYGVISSKEHQPYRTYSSVQSVVTVGANGQTSVGTIPTTEVDDEDWVLYIYGESGSGEPRIDVWYVDQATFDAYKKGDHISFDPNTMSRID